MRLALPLLVSLGLMLVGGSAATAGGPGVVPPFIQGRIEHRAAALAYAPTRLPLAYGYRSYRVAPGSKSVTYVFVRVPRASSHPPLTVTIARYRGPLAACGNARLQTLQIGGNKVYWDGNAAWRCLQPARGAPVRVSVTGRADPSRFATKFAYVRVAASVKHLS